jgi:hypothetical protein
VFYLQILDILTTLIGFSLGTTSLLVSKILAVGIATTCLRCAGENHSLDQLLVRDGGLNLYTTLRVLNA